MLDGKEGEAVRIAMSILSDIGDAVGAEEMVEIAHVHTDSGFYLGDAGLEFVEHLADLGQPCFATPAISQGTIYFRTTESLLAIK